jgi:probable F420-dependent oxidoreductase
MSGGIRFGLQAGRAQDRLDWARTARIAEESGYSTLLVPDHFCGTLGAFTALTAAAAVTTRLRLGTLVLANDLWNPMLLAREAASLDVLSNGRLELGLGTGWLIPDYDSTGIPRTPGRVERLREAVEIIRAVFRGRPFEFHGDHYRVSHRAETPVPLQPHVPLLIGGGSRKVLTLAGEMADTVGVHYDLRLGSSNSPDLTRAAVERKLAWLGHARFELQILVEVLEITKDAAGALARLSRRYGTPPEELAESPYVLVGTEQALVETIHRRRELYGFGYWVFRQRDLAVAAPLVSALTGADRDG